MLRISNNIKKCVAVVLAGALFFSACATDSVEESKNKPDDKKTEQPKNDDSKDEEKQSEKTEEKKSEESKKEEKSNTESGKSISVADLPVGYANVTVQTGDGTTVTTKSELVSALSKGGLIYVSGTIDVSEGMLPSEAGGSTSALDEFVKTKTDSLHSNHSDLYPNAFNTYREFKEAYAELCSSSTNDKSSSSKATTLSRTLWTLNSEYGNTIKLKVSKSNTTIIGLENAVIKGGSFQISNVSNVIIRNLTIQDAYDPFPHHEENDGFNAQWDNVCIDSAKNVWIDHCTFEDTMKYSEVKIKTGGKEKWQTYDGLCDIKGDATNITVSNSIFNNHDKTMLIGSSDSDGDNSKRFVTLCGNYFYNCGQRLPMVRNTTIHIFNNYYDASNSPYPNSYAIGRRKNCIIYAENNYFGSGIKYSVKESGGELHSSGNTDLSKNGVTSETDDEVFSSLNKYKYTVLSASDAKTSVLANAGAGCTLAE